MVVPAMKVREFQLHGSDEILIKEPRLRTKVDQQTFANQWISDWNGRDVEAVLAHFSENVVFTSPRAKAIMGSLRVEGKSRLREYWTESNRPDPIDRFHLGLCGE